MVIMMMVKKYKKPYGEFFCYSEFDENVPNDITKDKEKIWV